MANTAKLALILPIFNHLKLKKRQNNDKSWSPCHCPKRPFEGKIIMNKQALINAISDKSGLPQQTVKTALDATLAVISGTLAKGDDIALVGFGVFSVRTQKARTARNPQTGDKVQVPAKNAVSFKAGKGLKEAVN